MRYKNRVARNAICISQEGVNLVLSSTVIIRLLENNAPQVQDITKALCTYQCKPRGGGSAGKGWGFDKF